MSLLDSASLIVTPNAYKEGKLYSVIPSDGSGDMSVVRATTATRVNSAGLVELVPYNLLLNSVWNGVGANVAPTNYGITNFAAGTFAAGTFANSIKFVSPTSADRIMITQSNAVLGIATVSVYVEEVNGSITVENIINRTGGASTVVGFYENGNLISSSSLVCLRTKYIP